MALAACLVIIRPLFADGELIDQVSFAQSMLATLERAGRAPADAEAQIAKIEALLALGRAPAAEQAAVDLADRIALAAGSVSQPAGDASAHSRQQTTRALRLWMLARLRQALPLDDPRLNVHLDRLSAEPALSALRFWTASLAGRAPYRFASGSLPAELELKRSSVWSRFHSRQLESIQATIGRLTLPVVFVDTGAQYTLLSAAAARSAGVVTAEQSSEMVGFATFGASPG